MQEESKVWDPGVFDVIGDLVAKKEDGVLKVGEAFAVFEVGDRGCKEFYSGVIGDPKLKIYEWIDGDGVVFVGL